MEEAVKQMPHEAAGRPTIPPSWSAKVNQTTWINGELQTSIVPIGDMYMASNSVLNRTATKSGAFTTATQTPCC